jgi:hypothetical protein
MSVQLRLRTICCFKERFVKKNKEESMTEALLIVGLGPFLCFLSYG